MAASPRHLRASSSFTAAVQTGTTRTAVLPNTITACTAFWARRHCPPTSTMPQHSPTCFGPVRAVDSTTLPLRRSILFSLTSRAPVTASAVARLASSFSFLCWALSGWPSHFSTLTKRNVHFVASVINSFSLFFFKNFSPYLQASKRELLADYALPCSVIILSFLGSFIFRDIPGAYFLSQKCTLISLTIFHLFIECETHS